MRKLITFVLMLFSIINSFAQNVGIGTATPADKLSVVNVLPGYGITHAYGPVVMGTYISDLHGQFGTKTNHPLQFFTNNGSAQLTLLQNGKFGIGSELPTEKLDVAGNILSEGSVAGFRFNDRADNLKGYQWYSNAGNAYLYRVQATAGNVITVFENGNVGFNTSTPQTDLHVNPNGAGSILIGTNKNAGGYTNLEMGITAQTNGQSYIQSTNASGSNYGTLALNPNGGDVTVATRIGIGTNTPYSPLDIIEPADNSNAIRILEPGNIWGIYVSNNLYFNFNGSVRAGIDRNDGTYYSYSDKRLKKNISEIAPVLNKLLQLSVKKYQFIDTNEPSRYSTGFISQDAKELFPEFVSAFKRDFKDSTSYLAINYAGFSVIAIKAIQEQQAIIDRQQKSIEFLASEIDKLKSSLSFIQKNK